MIEGVAERLCITRPEIILIYEKYNAAYVQHFELNSLRGKVSRLYIGLPLMHSLTSQEMEAILAHELAHHDGDHSRFSAFVAFAGRAWKSILAVVERRAFLFDFTIGIFTRWYVPMYNAYFLALNRTNEYSADRVAADATNTEATAQALIRIELCRKMYAELVQRQLRAIADEAESPEPPPHTLRLIFDILRQAPPAERSDRWWRELCYKQESSSEKHPSLCNRLAAMGYPIDAHTPQKAGFVSCPSAETLLQPALPRLIDEVDALWRKKAAPTWKRFFDRRVERHEDWETADASEAIGALTPLQAKKRAKAIAALESNESALPSLQQAVALNPEDGELRYTLGEALVQKGDPSCEQHLERAAALRPIDEFRAMSLLQAFWTAQGDYARAAEYKQRAYAAYDEHKAAEKERASFELDDVAVAHDAGAATIAKIAAALRDEPAVKEAYLVRKLFSHFPRVSNVYGLVVVTHGSFLSPRSGRIRAQIAERLKPLRIYPSDTFVRIVSEDNWKMIRIANREPSALIYQREPR